MTATDISKTNDNFSPFLPRAAMWSAIVLYVAAVILFAWNPTPIAQLLAALGIAAALAHATLALGRRDALAFLSICLVVTFTIENIGVATGLPFGRYHFEVGASLPHVGLIPIVVGFLWFGMGYFAWVLAGVLLGDRGSENGPALVARPLVAAFVMTQWDLVMDPPEATIAKAWIWHQGGADFGVPISNYFGWLLTSWLFFQTFAVYLRARRASSRSAPLSRELRFAAILLYASSGLTHLTPWLMGESGEIADASGHIWRVHDLRESTVAVMLFTMFFTSLLACLRLWGETSENSS